MQQIEIIKNLLSIIASWGLRDIQWEADYGKIVTIVGFLEQHNISGINNYIDVIQGSNDRRSKMEKGLICLGVYEVS